MSGTTQSPHPETVSQTAPPPLRPEEINFSGPDTHVESFTDPSQLPPAIVTALLDTVIANRPDAEQLRQSLIVRFAKELGISDYGIAVQDHFMDKPGSPSLDPKTLYLFPHPRPTAGSIVMPAYTDNAGEIHMLLVKNWKDPNDHSKGLQEDWRFPGGFMEARMPNDPSGRKSDHNLQATAVREVLEETTLDLKGMNITPKELFIRSDCGHSTNAPSHAIDAFYLADLGRYNEAPPQRDGDDVGITRWVNLRDIAKVPVSPLFSAKMAEHNTGVYTVTIDGKPEPFSPAHVELLERGTAAMREKNFPLHEPGSCSCCKGLESQVSPQAQKHHDDVAQAHGFAKGIQITIQIGGNKDWQQRVADGRAASSEPRPTIH